MNAIIVLLAVLATQTAPATTTTTTATTPELRERLLVYGLKADGVDDRIVKSIERSIVSAAVDAGYDAISTQDIATLLDIEASRQAAGCDGESSCVAELAGGLGAKLVVTGTVVRLDDARFELSLTLLEQNATTVRNRATTDAASAAGLRDLTAETARRLLGAPAAPAPVAIDNTGAVVVVVVGAVAAGLGVVGVVGGGLQYLNAKTNEGYAQAAADAYDASGTSSDLRQLGDANAAYTQRAAAWNTWGAAATVIGGVLVVGGAVVTVMGIVALE